MRALATLTCLALLQFVCAPLLVAKDSWPLRIALSKSKTVRYVSLNGNDSGPGTFERPWASVNHAADVAQAGDVIVIRGGHYILASQIRVRSSGKPGAWITFVSFPGENVVLDAHSIQPTSTPGALNNGAFQIEAVSFIRVANLTVTNSRDAGFTVRDAADIDLINNITRGTFSSGIGVWDTQHNDRGTERIRILGNTIIRATTWALAPSDLPRLGEAPHEALSIGGAVDFEVAFNKIHDSDKEGIDIKETSKRGRVHHNLIRNVARQGIYVDAWFGSITNIEISDNVVHDCRGAGIVISGENGPLVENVIIKRNLVFNNDGTGVYFSDWGKDNTRRGIEISDNVIHHNGYGPPTTGQEFFWLPGGVLLKSRNVHDLRVEANIVTDNRGFEIGYGGAIASDLLAWTRFADINNIKIRRNLFAERRSIEQTIRSGGRETDRFHISSTYGDEPIFANTAFRDLEHTELPSRVRLAAAGKKPNIALYRQMRSNAWWKASFPPKLVEVRDAP